MGEEKKESKDIKKLIYEQPRLVKLNCVADAGWGDVPGCSNGTGEGTSCSSGDVAMQVCTGGSAEVSG